MIWVYAKIAVLIILVVYILHRLSWFKKQNFHCNNVDGRCYDIVNPGSSELFGQVNRANIRLLEHLRDNYSDDLRTTLLIKNYNPDNIFENIPISIKNTSFVENKGKRIGFCTIEKSTGSLHNFNLLYFVNLHELTHLAMHREDDVHEEDFWEDFAWLLKRAAEIGYQPTNYEKNPVVYCGLNIGYNPFFDKRYQDR